MTRQTILLHGKQSPEILLSLMKRKFGFTFSQTVDLSRETLPPFSPGQLLLTLGRFAYGKVVTGVKSLLNDGKIHLLAIPRLESDQSEKEKQLIFWSLKGFVAEARNGLLNRTGKVIDVHPSALSLEDLKKTKDLFDRGIRIKIPLENGDAIVVPSEEITSEEVAVMGGFLVAMEKARLKKR